MGYSRDIYEKAIERLSERRSRANRDARLRREMIEARIPRIVEIERETSKAGLQTARIIVAGGVDVKKQVEKLAEHHLALQKEKKTLLQEGGFPEDCMEPRFVCPKCKDEGYVDGMMCSCLKQLLREEAYQKLNRLSPLELCGFDNFDLTFYSAETEENSGLSPRKKMEGIFRFCCDYAHSFTKSSPSILMSGATGLGKTHLSLAIAKEAIQRGYGVVYGSAQNFMSQLERERFGRSGGNDDSLQPLLDCDLLILDDLGTEFITPFVTSTIYNLINTRLMTEKPTIISTNLSIASLEEKYSERIVSRIIGSYRVLKFLGRDIRQLKRSRGMSPSKS